MESHRFPKPERVFNCADPIRSLKCLRCTNFQTHKLVDLKDHFKEGHTLSEKEDKFYCCENCNFQTYSNYLYLRHKLFNLCKENFIIKSEGADPEQTTECRSEYCQPDNGEFQTPLKSALDHHFDKKHKSHKDALRKCEHCPYVTKHLKNLKSHILCRHTDLDKLQWFECEHCSYKTKLKSSLKSHINCKHNRIEVECDICKFKTNSNRGLQTHIIQKHSDPDTIEWFHCERCPYKNKIKKNLRSHMYRKHGKKKYFDCDYCPFQTKKKPSLQSHILCKHTDPDRIQWLQCAQCSFKTKTKPDLKSHINSKHNMIKFKCDHCQYEAKTNKGLQAHVLQKHSHPDDIQWFECEECPYRSPIKTNFKHHVTRTHRQKHSFECEHCEFVTRLKSSLRRHVLAKHTEPALGE